MNTTPTSTNGNYAFGYVTGRHAAKEFTPASDNPYRRGSAAFHGWNDGHYDERSSRELAVARHSAELWAN